MIKKGKRRVMITLHNETLKLLNELKALHEVRYTNSNLIEIALMTYAHIVLKQFDNEGEKDNGKN